MNATRVKQPYEYNKSHQIPAKLVQKSYKPYEYNKRYHKLKYKKSHQQYEYKKLPPIWKQ